MSPRRPPSPCTTPACPEVVDGGGPCPEHRRQREKARGNFRQRGYTSSWDKRRARFLRRNPTCVLCGQPATDADHYPVSRRQLLAQGVADPDADQHLRACCRSCHSRSTVRHDGGFGRTPTTRGGT
jgi:5-methylcytosine-specific restriction protein A